MIDALRLKAFDLLLIDWLLPDVSGLEVMAWAKDHLAPVPPIIMITARVAEKDIVEGLTAGADDYVTKPIHDDILKARVEAVLRRTYGASVMRNVEAYGDYIFDVRGRTLTNRTRPVVTTNKEFALALLLFRNLNRPLSRTHIMDVVWPVIRDTTSRTLDAHISQIRLALDLRPANGFRLSSIYGFGYRLEEQAEKQHPALHE